jgi:hypothetical protein
MEHDCECGFFATNNETSMDCPVCGEKCHSVWDEEFSDSDYWDDEEEEEVDDD